MKFMVSLIVSVAAILTGCGGGGGSNDTAIQSQSGSDSGAGPGAGQVTNGGNQGVGSNGNVSNPQAASWSNRTWSSVPYTFDASVSTVYMPTVSIDQSGDLILVYGQYDVLSKKHQSMASVRSLATGQWSRPVVISPSAETVVDAGTLSGYLAGTNRGTTIIGTDRRTGNALVAMITKPSADYPLRNSLWVTGYDKVTGAWSMPTRLGYQQGSGAKVEADELGHFIVAWTDLTEGQSNPSLHSVRAAVYNLSDRTWSPQTVIDSGGMVGAITLRATKAEPVRVRMAWETIGATATQINVASSSLQSLTAGQWQSNQSIGEGSAPTLSESLDFLAYQYSNKIALRTAGTNGFGDPEIFSGQPYNSNPAVVNNLKGEAMLVFTSTYSSVSRSGDQYQAKRNDDGTWTTATIASDYTFGGRGTMLSMDEYGDVLMTLHAGAPLTMRYAKVTNRWVTEGKAYTGWGEYISADPVNHRAVFMWMSQSDIKINIQMLK